MGILQFLKEYQFKELANGGFVYHLNQDPDFLHLCLCATTRTSLLAKKKCLNLVKLEQQPHCGAVVSSCSSRKMSTFVFL